MYHTPGRSIAQVEENLNPPDLSEKRERSFKKLFSKIAKPITLALSSIIGAGVISNSAITLPASAATPDKVTVSSEESPKVETREDVEMEDSQSELQSKFNVESISISKDSLNSGYFLVRSSQDGRTTPDIVCFALIKHPTDGKEYLLAYGGNTSINLSTEAYEEQLAILKDSLGHPDAIVMPQNHDHFVEQLKGQIEDHESGAHVLDVETVATYHRTLAAADLGVLPDKTFDRDAAMYFASSNLEQAEKFGSIDDSYVDVFKGILAARAISADVRVTVDHTIRNDAGELELVDAIKSRDITPKLISSIEKDDFDGTRAIETAIKELGNKVDRYENGDISFDDLRIYYALATIVSNETQASVERLLPGETLENLTGEEAAQSTYGRTGRDRDAIFQHNQRVLNLLQPVMDRMYAHLAKNVDKLTPFDAELVFRNLPNELFLERYAQNIGQSGGSSMTAHSDTYLSFMTALYEHHSASENAYMAREATQRYATLLASADTGDIKIKQQEFQLTKQLNEIEEKMKAEKYLNGTEEQVLAALSPHLDALEALKPSFDKLPDYSFKAGVLRDSLVRVLRLTVKPTMVPVSETASTGNGSMDTGHTDRTTTGSRETRYDKERIIRTNAYKLVLKSYFPIPDRFSSLTGEFELSYGFGGKTKMTKIVPAPIPGAIKGEGWRAGTFESKEPIVFAFALEDANDMRKPAEVKATLASKETPITVAITSDPVQVASNESAAPAVDPNDVDTHSFEKTIKLAGGHYKMRIVQKMGQTGTTASSVEAGLTGAMPTEQ